MSIKIKFTLLIVIFIIFLVAVLTYLSVTRQEKLLIESTDKRIKILMVNAADTIREGMISADDLLLTTTIRKIKERNEDIIDVFLVDKRGSLIFHSDISVMNKILTIGKLEHYDDYISKRALNSRVFLKQKVKKYYLYSYPIMDNNIRIGTLFVKFSFERIMENIAKTKKNLIITSLFILLVFIFITYFFTAFLLEPVRALSEGVRIIGSGNLDHRIFIKQNDELGELANNFNKMTEELKISRQKIIEKELLERDLEIASEIQSFLIPRQIPNIKDVSIGRYYNPARFVGGDYYDIVEIGPNKYGIIIIDVSGKGSGAAIIMAVITFIFHSEAFKTYAANKLMSVLNNKLIDRIPEERFATGIYIIYDAENGIIQYTNAGHSELLYYQHSTKKVFGLKKATSMPIGIAKDVEYTRAAFRFQKGDAILLQTDGIYEAMNINKEEFTLERVKKAFGKYAPMYENPDDINNSIIKEIESFVGKAKQHDDMTLITIKKS